MRPGLVLWVVLLLPTVAGAQVIARVNEHVIDGELITISVNSVPQFAADGRYVAFTGSSVRGGAEALWIKELGTPRGVISKIDIPTEGVFAISGDARDVAFVSARENLVPDKHNQCWHDVGRGSRALQPCFDVFVRNLTTGELYRVFGPEGREIAADSGGRLQFSRDGRWLLYQRTLSDNPSLAGPSQVLLHDRETRTTSLVSGNENGRSGVMTDDASRIAYINIAIAGTSSIRTITIVDRATGLRKRIESPERALVDEMRISADGRYIAYDGFCQSCPLLTNTRVVVYDVVWDRSFEPVVGTDGAVPNFGASVRGLSADGRYLLLESSSTNLVEGARLGNIYVFDRMTGRASHVSRGLDGTLPNGVSFNPSVTGDALLVAFHSQADAISPYPPAWPPFSNHLYVASLDLDNDRLHDTWERYFFGTTLTTDPAFDDDGDGLPNLQEFERQSHPRGRYGITVSAPPESDTWGIKLHNLNTRVTTIILRIVDSHGVAAARAIELPPSSLTPIHLSDLPDRPRDAFLLHVESDEPVFGLSRDWRER